MTQVEKFLLRKRIQALASGLIGPHPMHVEVRTTRPEEVAQRPVASPPQNVPDVVTLMRRRLYERGGK